MFHNANADSSENYKGKTWFTLGQKIAAGEKANFLEWSNKLKELKNVKLNYNNSYSKVESEELHYFSEASPEAMYTVAYLKAKTESGVPLCFLISKCSIAPMKHQKNSKLELQAGL